MSTSYSINWRVDCFDNRKGYKERFVSLFLKYTIVIRGWKFLRHYCHKGTETIVIRGWKIISSIVIRRWKLLSRGLIIYLPIFPYGKIDNRGNDDRIIDRVKGNVGFISS